MEKIVYETSYGKSYGLYLTVTFYQTNYNMAIALETEDGEPYATLTVNLEDLPSGYAFIDTNNLPGIDKVVESSGLGKNTGAIGYSGWCEYPLYEFDLNKLKEVSSPRSDYFDY